MVSFNDETATTANPELETALDSHVKPKPIVSTATVTTQSGRTSRPSECLIHVMTSIANYDGTHELEFQTIHPVLHTLSRPEQIMISYILPVMKQRMLLIMKNL